MAILPIVLGQVRSSVMVMAHIFMNLVIALHLFKVMCHAGRVQSVQRLFCFWTETKVIVIQRGIEFGVGHESDINEDFVVGVMMGILYIFGKRHQVVKGLSTTKQAVEVKAGEIASLKDFKAMRSWCDQFTHFSVLWLRHWVIA